MRKVENIMNEKDVRKLEFDYEGTKRNITGFAIITGIIVSVIGMMALAFLIVPFFLGFVAWWGWNYSMPTMFQTNTITFWNAVILVATLFNMHTPIARQLPYTVAEMISNIADKTEKKEKVEPLKLTKDFIVSVLELCISLVVTSFMFQYTWNTIIPNVINRNINMVHISFGVALGFVLLYNVLFVFPRGSNNQKKKDDEKTDMKTKSNPTEDVEKTISENTQNNAMSTESTET